MKKYLIAENLSDLDSLNKRLKELGESVHDIKTQTIMNTIEYGDYYSPEKITESDHVYIYLITYWVEE